jgi:hypothetical protein
MNGFFDGLPARCMRVRVPKRRTGEQGDQIGRTFAHWAISYTLILGGFFITGTDVMILKIFSPKNSAKKWRFLLQTKLNFEKNRS